MSRDPALDRAEALLARAKRQLRFARAMAAVALILAAVLVTMRPPPRGRAAVAYVVLAACLVYVGLPLVRRWELDP